MKVMFFNGQIQTINCLFTTVRRVKIWEHLNIGEKIIIKDIQKNRFFDEMGIAEVVAIKYNYNDDTMFICLKWKKRKI